MTKRITPLRLLAGAATAGAIGFGALPLLAQGGGGPTARYEMRAETTSGMGAMGQGGGMGSALSMAFGGGGRSSAQHSLQLDLGSSLAPADGRPKADHFMPSVAKLGKSVPLKTPVNAAPEEVPTEFQRPKGRMLIYWGCGEHAPKGQPVVIDFARLVAGQVPPGLFSTNVPTEHWVSAANSRTFGEWPNSDSKATVKSDSSLIGAHRIAGNYSPEIAFTLTKDFMAPLAATHAVQGSGSVLMNWNQVPDATGYYAWIIGGKSDRSGEMADIVWWSSSATREFGGGLSDWLSPPTVARLVANRTVMSPQTTTCTVPAEVRRDAPDYMFAMLNAYGPEESFAFPPRPANPKTPWNPIWTSRIMHKSMTSFLVGMPGMDGASGEAPQQCQPKKKKKGFGGLGGALGGAIGGVLGGGGSGDECE